MLDLTAGPAAAGWSAATLDGLNPSQRQAVEKALRGHDGRLALLQGWAHAVGPRSLLPAAAAAAGCRCCCWHRGG